MNVLFIDNSIPDYIQFVESANKSTYPIVYSSESTKSDILSQLQSNFTSISRIGICFVSIGAKSPLFLDSAPFFENSNTQFIINIIIQFNVVNIDYLACNTLNFNIWSNYYHILSQNTSVVVGASNDRTGNIKYGGDWVMESTGQDIGNVYFTSNIEYYQYLLDIGYVSIVLKMDGTIWGTGYNFSGQLGNGNNTTTNVLVQMINTTGKTPSLISSSEDYTIVLMTDGTVWGTGLNDGAFGNGNNTNTNVLVQMINTTGKTPVSISCGNQYTIVLMTDGTVWGTGRNQLGQIGNGNNTNTNVLVQMINTTGKTPVSISCGNAHTIVLMTDGTVWGTGYNGDGELGTGDNTDSNTLVQMLNTTGKIPNSISTGSYHTLLLMTDKTVWGTGYNGDGELGTGDYTDSNILLPITTNVNRLLNYRPVFLPPSPPSPPSTTSIQCFLQDSQILTNHGYIPIQYLKPGDLVKTLHNGHKPIRILGYNSIRNPAIADRIRDQLYVCSPKQYPELFEDLVITGCHSILVDGFKDQRQIDEVIEILGHIYITDGKYRLPACIDDRTTVYAKSSECMIYHIALEHDDYYMNYGIFANGLLVETCSNRFLKELSNMSLLE